MKRGLLRREQRRGQTLVEYALIIAFIAIVAVSVLYWQGQSTASIFNSMSSALATSPASH
jgi:Flp pilus assembly pilin Flp